MIGVGSETIVRRFDQTLALEDCDVYTAKQFIYGEPEDKYTSFVLNLDFSSHGAPTPNDEPDNEGAGYEPPKNEQASPLNQPGKKEEDTPEA